MTQRRSIFIHDGDYVTADGIGFVVATGADAAIADRVRELSTPEGALAIPAMDAYGLVMLDRDYGNPVYHFRSAPLDEIPVDAILAKQRAIIARDPALTVVDVKQDPAASAAGVVRTLYTVVSGNETRRFGVDVDGSMIVR